MVAKLIILLLAIGSVSLAHCIKDDSDICLTCENIVKYRWPQPGSRFFGFGGSKAKASARRRRDVNSGDDDYLEDGQKEDAQQERIGWMQLCSCVCQLNDDASVANLRQRVQVFLHDYHRDNTHDMKFRRSNLLSECSQVSRGPHAITLPARISSSRYEERNPIERPVYNLPVTQRQNKTPQSLQENENNSQGKNKIISKNNNNADPEEGSATPLPFAKTLPGKVFNRLRNRTQSLMQEFNDWADTRQTSEETSIPARRSLNDSNRSSTSMFPNPNQTVNVTHLQKSLPQQELSQNSQLYFNRPQLQPSNILENRLDNLERSQKLHELRNSQPIPQQPIVHVIKPEVHVTYAPAPRRPGLISAVRQRYRTRDGVVSARSMFDDIKEQPEGGPTSAAAASASGSNGVIPTNLLVNGLPSPQKLQQSSASASAASTSTSGNIFPSTINTNGLTGVQPQRQQSGASATATSASNSGNSDRLPMNMNEFASVQQQRQQSGASAAAASASNSGNLNPSPTNMNGFPIVQQQPQQSGVSAAAASASSSANLNRPFTNVIGLSSVQQPPPKTVASANNSLSTPSAFTGTQQQPVLAGAAAAVVSESGNRPTIIINGIQQQPQKDAVVFTSNNPASLLSVPSGIQQQRPVSEASSAAIPSVLQQQQQQQISKISSPTQLSNVPQTGSYPPASAGDSTINSIPTNTINGQKLKPSSNIPLNLAIPSSVQQQQGIDENNNNSEDAANLVQTDSTDEDIDDEPETDEEAHGLSDPLGPMLLSNTLDDDFESKQQELTPEMIENSMDARVKDSVLCGHPSANPEDCKNGETGVDVLKWYTNVVKSLADYNAAILGLLQSVLTGDCF